MEYSRPVESNQTAPHPRTVETALKHGKAPWRKPVADHSRRVFDQIAPYLDRPLWLDTGCGTGESTARLADEHPDLFILGIDKSDVRLQAHRALLAQVFPQGLKRDNYRLFRGDLEDLWRLFSEQGIRFAGQTFYYPNPWPKAEQRLRRWPLHPVFPYALSCSSRGELRTNWLIYAQEWTLALEALTGTPATIEPWSPEEPQTPFERKYQKSGHGLWRLTYELETSALEGKDHQKNAEDGQS